MDRVACTRVHARLCTLVVWRIKACGVTHKDEAQWLVVWSQVGFIDGPEGSGRAKMYTVCWWLFIARYDQAQSSPTRRLADLY